jgi:hypothetical protein
MAIVTTNEYPDTLKVGPLHTQQPRTVNPLLRKCRYTLTSCRLTQPGTHRSIVPLHRVQIKRRLFDVNNFTIARCAHLCARQSFGCL